MFEQAQKLRLPKRGEFFSLEVLRILSLGPVTILPGSRMRGIVAYCVQVIFQDGTYIFECVSTDNGTQYLIPSQSPEVPWEALSDAEISPQSTQPSGTAQGAQNGPTDLSSPNPFAFPGPA